MNNKTIIKYTGKLLFIITFFGIISFLGINNFNNISKYIEDSNKKKEKSKSTNIVDLKKNISDFEQYYKEKFYKRSNLIDLYGLSLIALNKNTVLNIDYIKINDYMHGNFYDKTIKRKSTAEQFAKGLLALKEKADIMNTPILYVRIPHSSYIINSNLKYILNNKLQEEMDYTVSYAKKNNIQILDLWEVYKENNTNLSDIFFRTDAHPTTYAEWFAAKLITDIMETNGFIYPNKDIVFNINNYEILSKPFRGSAVRSTGQFFTKEDTFDMYIPKFNTNISLIYPKGNGKKGTFYDSVMNGLDKKNKYAYWILNFGHFSRNKYTYINNLANNNYKILFIGDSTVMRTFSYLTLLNKNVTVLDPRWNNSKAKLLDDTLKETHFDFIIVMHAFDLLYYDFFGYNSIN